MERTKFDQDVLRTSPTTSEDFITESANLDLFAHILGTTKSTTNKLLAQATQLLADQQQRETLFASQSLEEVSEEQLKIACFTVRAIALFRAAEQGGSTLIIKEQRENEQEN